MAPLTDPFDIIFGTRRGSYGGGPASNKETARRENRVMLDPSLLLIESGLDRAINALGDLSDISDFTFMVPSGYRDLAGSQRGDALTFFTDRRSRRAPLTRQNRFIDDFRVAEYTPDQSEFEEFAWHVGSRVPSDARAILVEELHFLKHQSLLLSWLFRPVKALGDLERVLVLKALLKLDALDPMGPGGTDVQRLKKAGRWIVVTADLAARSKLAPTPVESLVHTAWDVLVAVDP